MNSRQWQLPLAGGIALLLAIPAFMLEHDIQSLRMQADHLRRYAAEQRNPVAAASATGDVARVNELNPASASLAASDEEKARVLTERASLEQALSRSKRQWAQIVERNLIQAYGSMRPPELTPEMTAPENLQNVGRASAENALQTLAWANQHHDLALFAECIRLDPDDERRVADLLAAAPAATRARFSTPEQFAAAMIMLGWNRTVLAPGRQPMQYVGERTEAGNETRVWYNIQLPTGDVKENCTLRFCPNADGWRCMIGKPEVDQMALTLADLPPAQWDYLGR